MQKASNIISSNSDQFIIAMEVFYIHDDRLKQDNWLEKLKIDVDDYGWAPSYLDGDQELSSKKYTYHYSISYSKKYGDIRTLTFEQFKQLVYEKLEIRNSTSN